MTDNINQPAHYTAGGIETIDVIEQVLGKYDHRDQVEKYNQRAHLKGNFQQDLEKARWYLNRTIENCEKGLLESGTGTPIKEQPKSEYATDLDTESVHEDGDGDFWAFNYAEDKWFYYRMDDGEVTGRSPVGYTKGQMVAFTRDFFTRVENTFAILMAILRYEEEDEDVIDNSESEIVLSETDPADMPVGTVVYRDGVRLSYYVRKEAEGWILSHCGFSFYNSDSLVASWFENEEGWSLEEPTDVYVDPDGDFWADMGEGWRWHYINNGVLEYTSIRFHALDGVKDIHSIEKLSDRDALRIRRIIREGGN